MLVLVPSFVLGLLAVGASCAAVPALRTRRAALLLLVVAVLVHGLAAAGALTGSRTLTTVGGFASGTWLVAALVSIAVGVPVALGRGVLWIGRRLRGRATAEPPRIDVGRRRLLTGLSLPAFA